MAAIHGFQVFELGFLSNPEFYQMGVPAVPLARLYAAEAWRKLGKVEILPRTPAQRVDCRKRRGARARHCGRRAARGLLHQRGAL